MKKVKIIENAKILVKIEVDDKIIDLELEIHDYDNEGHCWDECNCPFKDICYLGGDDENDDKKHIDIRLGKFSGNYGEQNIGWLCDNLANMFNNNIETLRPTYESMIRLNEVLGLVKDQKTTEEDIKILAELKNKLSSDAEKEDSKPKLEILL